MNKGKKSIEKYNPSVIEKKWQKKWEESGLYASDLSKKNKYYVLAEFPYPSGDLHMGHWFTFCGADIFARFKRMEGYQVFFPNGFDAFGLPAENAAIKRGVHPKDWTEQNIKKMKEQFATMGGSFSYDHEVITCEPIYYKWNQWIFIQMFKKGIAYKSKTLSNWCPIDQTVLANEHVENGKCWRCGSEVVQKEVEQWFLKITDYADRLEWPKKPSVDWPESVRRGQNDWIGKSTGIVIKFDNIEIFGTRQDTIFGATFIVLAPEHPFVAKLKNKEVKDYVEKARKKTDLERKENKEKTGVFTGYYVKNPMNGEKVPVWVADYVLMGYGTGAVMGVPAHDQRDFEFAKQFGLPIKEVVKGGNLSKAAYIGEGEMVNSGKYDGMQSNEAREKISDYLEQRHLGERRTNYHLHDWSVSRQRYWGTPVPMIHCPKCEVVSVPEKDLPVELPYDVDYAPKGKPPLASNEEWLSVSCPKCGGVAKRDAETLDTFVDSSWYFFRYVDPTYDKEPFDPELVEGLMPVDIYFGGAEHTLGHTLYSRFFTKFFHDIGLTDLEEYATKRVNHGIVLGPDGQKMSKSRGNVVNPDDEVKRYGADAVRVFVAFFIPYDGTGSWISERIWGPYRFLERVWQMQEKVGENALSKEDLFQMHRAIKKVGSDIANIKFNTAIAALMEWINYLGKKEVVSREEFKMLILLLAPFAPHMAEELWQRIEEKYSVHASQWPIYDDKQLLEKEVTIAVQVNGKIRDTIQAQSSKLKAQNEVEELARKSTKISKHLQGKSVKKVVYVQGKIINFVTS